MAIAVLIRIQICQGLLRGSHISYSVVITDQIVNDKGSRLDNKQKGTKYWVTIC